MQYGTTWNRSGRSSYYQANVCCMALEKPVDVISEVLNSEKFSHFARTIDGFAASA